MRDEIHGVRSGLLNARCLSLLQVVYLMVTPVDGERKGLKEGRRSEGNKRTEESIEIYEKLVE